MMQAKPTMDVFRSYDDKRESEETVFFLLQDSSHEFTMGLSDILKCVQLAEKEGFVPLLPKDWWSTVANSYVDFREYYTPSEDED